MNLKIVFKITPFIFVVAILLCLHLLIQSRANSVSGGLSPAIPTPIIVGILVTGKDDARVRLAQIAARHFFEQSYPWKRLIVVNHHPSRAVMSVPDLEFAEKGRYPLPMVELRVDRQSLTLGDLRNMALNLVPWNACWITWDDDDWRHPHFLHHLHQDMERHQADVSMFSRRFEINLTNGYVWKTEYAQGFVHFLCKQDHRIRYLRQDTLEDLNLRQQFQKLKKRVFVNHQNDPGWYVRTVHRDNTSTFVKSTKDKVVPSRMQGIWKEEAASPSETAHVQKIMLSYFKTGSP